MSIEERRQRRREKFLAKLAQVYPDDYPIVEDTKTNNSTEETNTNIIKEPRRIRGCPHWKQGCKYEGVPESVKEHLKTCAYEILQPYIRRKDKQVETLQKKMENLETQLNQLQSIVNTFVVFASPRMRAQVVSKVATPLELERSHFKEMYDSKAPIDLTLKALPESIRVHAIGRREVCKEKITEHEKHISGRLTFLWRSIPYEERKMDNKEYSEISNLSNSELRNEPLNNEYNSHNKSLPRTSTTPKFPSQESDDLLDTEPMNLHAMCLFWDKILAGSKHGTQVWNFYIDKQQIRGLSPSHWLSHKSTFSICTGPFGNPYLVFTGHQECIQVWSYQQILEEVDEPLQSIPNPEIGPVSCLAICGKRLFASCQTKDIHIWQCPKKYLHRRVNTSIDKDHHYNRSNPQFSMNYLDKMPGGHMSVITVLKSYGNVLISASKDGIIQIWSVSHLKRLSMLFYPHSVLDVTIFPNPLPLCHVSMYQNCQSTMSRTTTSSTTTTTATNAPKDSNHLSIDEEDLPQISPQSSQFSSPRGDSPSLQDPISNILSGDEHPNSDGANDTTYWGKTPQHFSEYANIRKIWDEHTPPSIHDNDQEAEAETETETETEAEAEVEVEEEETKESISHPPINDDQFQNSDTIDKDNIHTSTPENIKKERQLLLSGELTSTVLPHLQFDMAQLRLIIGGESGEIHIWHVVNWTREKILRGHGDKVTCLEAFGNRLVSGYANGNIKLWNEHFHCIGTAFGHPLLHPGSHVVPSSDMFDIEERIAATGVLVPSPIPRGVFPKKIPTPVAVRCLLLIPCDEERKHNESNLDNDNKGTKKFIPKNIKKEKETGNEIDMTDEFTKDKGEKNNVPLSRIGKLFRGHGNKGNGNFENKPTTFQETENQVNEDDVDSTTSSKERTNVALFDDFLILTGLRDGSMVMHRTLVTET